MSQQTTTCGDQRSVALLAGLQGWFSGPARPSHWLAIGLLGVVLYFPWLGTSGLWDCWEPHYAEVAREMVERGNWLEPTWEHSPGQSLDRKYFFSKPILSMWLMAVPMKLFGIHAPHGGIAPGVEWVLRIPFALLAIVGLLAVFALATRFFGLKTGLLAAFILGTSPQYYFIARQAMTDMPLVSLMTAGMACMVLGGFDDRPRPRLIYLGWALLGLSVLAKGLTGFLLPGLVFGLYFLVSGDWGRLKTMRVFSGALLALLVAAPWYVYLSIASTLKGLLDEQGRTFFQRFFLHDHLYRLASGVHGDRGTFAYFIEQLGPGLHPWFPFAIWGVLQSGAAPTFHKPESPVGRAGLFCWLWAVGGFAVISFSVTKFHHYALLIAPALAILAAKTLVDWLQGRSNPGRLLTLLLVLFVVLISRDIGLMPKGLTDLFVYNYTRTFPEAEARPGQIGFAILFGLMSLGLSVFYLWGAERLRRFVLVFLSGGAFLSAIWGGWYFFNAMGPHWSQRHLFDTYYALRQEGEPIGAFLMNWRGETFYSRNEVVQLKTNDKLKEFDQQHRNKRRFYLVEQHRLGRLKKQLPPAEQRAVRILDRTCNKFFLIGIDSWVGATQKVK